MLTLKTNDWFPPDDFPIAVERRDPQERFALHAQDFSEIVIILGGSALHVTGSESQPVVAGDVFVVGGFGAHEYREMKDLRLVYILFRPEKLRMELLDLSGLTGYQALFTVESPGHDHELKMRNPWFSSGLSTAQMVESADDADFRR